MQQQHLGQGNQLGLSLDPEGHYQVQEAPVAGSSQLVRRVRRRNHHAANHPAQLERFRDGRTRSFVKDCDRSRAVPTPEGIWGQPLIEKDMNKKV